MKEHPILFSTPMVQAILEGRKTQTRRIIKPQPIDNTEVDGNFFEGNHKGYVKVDGHPTWQKQFVHEFSNKQVGDVLWVRETTRCMGFDDDENEPTILIQYKDETSKWIPAPNRKSMKASARWTPSIHMLKEACRIRLEINNVNVEKLQDISEEDAKAEGVRTLEIPSYNGKQPYENYIRGNAHYHTNAKDSFKSLWQSINGAERWDSNPWVWVISFKRV